MEEEGEEEEAVDVSSVNDWLESREGKEEKKEIYNYYILDCIDNDLTLGTIKSIEK